nr:hypothetical protein [Eubacterium sp.]
DNMKKIKCLSIVLFVCLFLVGCGAQYKWGETGFNVTDITDQNVSGESAEGKLVKVILDFGDNELSTSMFEKIVRQGKLKLKDKSPKNYHYKMSGGMQFGSSGFSPMMGGKVEVFFDMSKDYTPDIADVNVVNMTEGEFKALGG